MPVFVRTTDLDRRSVRPETVRTRAERMLRAMKMGKRELSVLLCSDAVIHDLNRTYRGKDRATDVLAFALDEGEGPATALLGDVVISLDTARRQAEAAGRSIAFEVTTLLAHGLLHLLGYDHRNVTEERQMKAKTDILVSAAIARKPR